MNAFLFHDVILIEELLFVYDPPVYRAHTLHESVQVVIVFSVFLPGPYNTRVLIWILCSIQCRHVTDNVIEKNKKKNECSSEIIFFFVSGIFWGHVVRTQISEQFALDNERRS